MPTPAVVAAFVLGVLPATGSTADPAPPITASDLLVSALDPSIPIDEEETGELLRTTGDSRFTSSVGAFIDTVLTEQWFEIDRDGVAIPGRTSQDLATVLTEISYGRSDPGDCWDDDSPELVSIAGAAYGAPYDDGSIGTIIQAVDEFVDSGAAQRMVDIVTLGVAEERQDQLSHVRWQWGPDELRDYGQVYCFWLEDGASDLTRCQSIPICFVSDTYLIASNDRWVVRFEADFLVTNSEELEGLARVVIAPTAG